MRSHAPRFGLNVHTTVSDADPVRAVQHAEQLGFDLVTVHRDVVAGEPPSYDMWTLMTWLAARTSTITLSSNVLIAANRHPAHLAKMAASLDRLSGGRLVLALGAGAPINDAGLRGIGLPVRSPAAAVAALAEVIEILRGLWSGQPLTHRGALVAMENAVVSPHLSRPVPIWVGAYGPRMLRLVGERADGWLPSAFILPPERIGPAIRDIERAARDAGRDPTGITFAYNVAVQVGGAGTSRPGHVQGTADEVAARLADLVRLGFDVLSLWPVEGSDEQRELIATAVLPAVRDRLSS